MIIRLKWRKVILVPWNPLLSLNMNITSWLNCCSFGLSLVDFTISRIYSLLLCWFYKNNIHILLLLNYLTQLLWCSAYVIVLLLCFSLCYIEYLKYASCTQKAQQDSEACANKYKETMHFMKPNANQEHHENITLNENIKTICWWVFLLLLLLFSFWSFFLSTLSSFSNRII